VALCRTLTEAAQSRVTEIAGARDDLTSVGYQRASSGRATRPASPSKTDTVAYHEISSVRNTSLMEDVHTAVAGVLAVTGRSPLVADHTVDEVGIPVVRVVCPGLLCDPVLL